MVTSPFFRISVADTGEDITDLCDGLDYEESAEKDDLLNITIKTKNVFLAGQFITLRKGALMETEIEFASLIIGNEYLPKCVMYIIFWFND